jgi:hypothetical protein
LLRGTRRYRSTDCPATACKKMSLIDTNYPQTRYKLRFSPLRKRRTCADSEGIKALSIDNVGGLDRLMLRTRADSHSGAKLARRTSRGVLLVIALTLMGHYFRH